MKRLVCQPVYALPGLMPSAKVNLPSFHQLVILHFIILFSKTKIRDKNTG
jgi:hypothetical protein